jgi:hypothetical protein
LFQFDVRAGEVGTVIWVQQGLLNAFNDGANATLHRDMDFSFDLVNNSDTTLTTSLRVTALAQAQAARLQALPVPEPRTASLAMLGLAGLVFARRRRSKAAANFISRG